MCAPTMLTSHPGSGILGKKCGTIILLAEELGNCRVSCGRAGEGVLLGVPTISRVAETH